MVIATYVDALSFAESRSGPMNHQVYQRVLEEGFSLSSEVDETSRLVSSEGGSFCFESSSLSSHVRSAILV